MKEVTLVKGLKFIQEYGGKLLSDGLSSDEYIHYVNGVGICYEDGCIIGKNDHHAYRVLDRLDWTHNHKFFLET